MNRLLFFLTFLVPIVIFSMIAAKKGDVNKTFKGVALGGHDPVAYHTFGRASKGDAKVRTEYDDAFYHFTSHSNVKLFKENPKAYLPAYGGYCAYGVAKDGSRNEVDVEEWKIIGGRLYLFQSRKEKTEFNYRSKELIQQANVNWLQ